MESVVPDLMLSAPTSILGFVALMMAGVFYLVKVFLDMNKEIFKDALVDLRQAIQNNTVAVNGLVQLVKELVEDREDK